MTRTAGGSVPPELWLRVAAATQYDKPAGQRRFRSGWMLLGLGLLSGGVGGTWLALADRTPRDVAADLERARARQEAAAAQAAKASRPAAPAVDERSVGRGQ
jgi:zona occludens toxin (predicted ATPase)